MSVAYSIDGQGDTAETVDLNTIDKSALRPGAVSYNAQTGTELCTYKVYPTATDEGVTVITLRRASRPSDFGNNRAKIATSITVSSTARAVDSVSGAVVALPIEAGVFLNLPNYPVEVDDVLEFLGQAFGLTYDQVSSGARDTEVVKALMYGQLNVFG